jgi:hypothetical protein
MGRLITNKTCDSCGKEYHPWSVSQKYCTRQCWLEIHNAEPRMSTDTAKKIGDALRDRGEGKTYRKVGGRHEHRTVAEAKLGRPLLPGEVVHHTDHDKRNNHPDNLMIFASQADHARYHRGEL